MPKLVCRCGYVHDRSPIPDAGWLTVQDSQYEELLAAEAARDATSSMAPGASTEAGEIDRHINELTGALYECPKCGRLLWQRPGEREFRSFSPDAPAS